MPFTKEEIQKLRQRLDATTTAQEPEPPQTPSGSGNFTSADISSLRNRLDEKIRLENEQAAKERSTPLDILLGIPRGVVGAAELSQRATRAGEGALIPGKERGPLGKLVTKGIDAIKDYSEDASWMTGKREGLSGTISQGVEQATQSIVAGIPGMAAGAAAGSAIPGVGTLLGGLIGFATSGGVQFGLAQYDDVIERADEAGILREESQPAAIRSGLYEGGFEFLSDLLEGWLMGVTKPLTAPAKQIAKDGIKALFKMGWKEALKKTAATVAAETSTEMVTAGLQAEEERRIGLGDTKMWDAAKEAFGPSVVASLIFAGL